MEYKNSDILLYSIKTIKDQQKMIIFYNDKAKIQKYFETGNLKDAPVEAIDYTEEKENTILSEMKKIESFDFVERPNDIGIDKYTKELLDDKAQLNNSNILVKYTDGTSKKFAGSNYFTIKYIKEAQKRFTKAINIEEFAKLPEEEKVIRKTKNNKNWRKSLAATLAAISLMGTMHHAGKAMLNKEDDMPTEDPIGFEDTILAEKNLTKEELKAYAAKLYDDAMHKNNFILTYQQISKVNMTEELAYSIVEMMNGIYPSKLTNLSDEQKIEEMTQIISAIDLINAGNLYSEVKEENMVDLSEFIKDETSKALVHNSLIIAREVVNESIGEPLNGKIMEGYQSINVFSKKYTNAVDQLLNYEWETINSTEFYQLPAGTARTIVTIWEAIGAQIPKSSYITREKSEFEPREHDLYYRYFIDESTNTPFFPRPSDSGECEYVKVYEDKDGCHEEVYTEAVMFAMAGDQYTAHDQETGIEKNPNIHQMGIVVEIDNRKNEEEEVLFLNKKEKIEVKKDNIDAAVATGLGIGAVGAGAYSLLTKKEEEEEEIKTNNK